MKILSGMIDISYNQFYVCDDILKPLAPENWTNEAINLGVLYGDNIIAIKCDDGQYQIDLEILEKNSNECFEDNFFELFIPNKIIGIYQWPFDKILSQKIDSEKCKIKWKIKKNCIELKIMEIFA